MSLLNKMIWATQLRKHINGKNKTKRNAEEIVKKRNAIFDAMLEADRKETGKVEVYKSWVDALDWVLGKD